MTKTKETMLLRTINLRFTEYNILHRLNKKESCFVIKTVETTVHTLQDYGRVAEGSE